MSVHSEPSCWYYRAWRFEKVFAGVDGLWYRYSIDRLLKVEVGDILFADDSILCSVGAPAMLKDVVALTSRIDD